VNIRPKFRNAALAGALAAVAATAWATTSTLGTSAYVPDYRAESQRPLAPPPGTIAVEESLAPNETIVTTYPGTAAVSTDEAVVTSEGVVVERGVTQPAIIVEDRRLTLDERIRADVMDRLAQNPRLSGRIGVESEGAVVRLSGYTSTVGQARHAGRDARGVVGVRYVRNEIRPRVGGSV
jgi:hypothetical protein